MTATVTISTEQRLTVVKHLARGKTLDVTAALTRLPRQTVLDIGSEHGYPKTDSLQRAVGLLEQRIEREHAPTEHPDARAIAADTRTPHNRPAADASTPPAAGPTITRDNGALTQPDEIRILLNTAKGHASKRIQGQANKVIDAVDRLRTMIREDQEKNAEKRRIAAEKQAARAEVDRLEAQLRAAKEKLRGTTTTPATTRPATGTDDGPSARDIRAWASTAGVDCPTRGQLPASVRAAYEAAHDAA